MLLQCTFTVSIDVFASSTPNLSFSVLTVLQIWPHWQQKVASATPPSNVVHILILVGLVRFRFVSVWSSWSSWSSWLSLSFSPITGGYCSAVCLLFTPEDCNKRSCTLSAITSLFPAASCLSSVTSLHWLPSSLFTALNGFRYEWVKLTDDAILVLSHALL